jgi:hypothetical protein
MPCYSEKNVNTQRGTGVFDKSILGLLKLNQLGYGPFPKPETRNPRPEILLGIGGLGFRRQRGAVFAWTHSRVVSAAICVEEFRACVKARMTTRGRGHDAGGEAARGV